MKSGSDNSSSQDTATVTKELEEPSAKQNSTSWWKEKNCPRLKGDEASAMPAVYPHGKVSVSSLGSFLSVGSSYKPSYTSVPLSLGVHFIQEYLKKNRGRKRKKSSHMRRRPGTSSRLSK